MMKTAQFLITFLLFQQFASAQAPAIEWQKSFGGFEYDFASRIVQTASGDFIISGSSSSDISGEKTIATFGAIDYWLIKTDAFGNELGQWAYGGSFSDVLTNAEPTADGGLILAGYSDSDISGNKTTGTYGLNDAWLIKLDNAGNVEWQNNYGGDGNDYLQSIRQTADGGYILGIDSWSGSTGIKTDTLSGASDFWIIKIDASGNVEWQKAYGSTGADILTFLFITNDGGYFFGGHSDSNAGGAKSENNFGFNDYWVVKIDASGNVIWDNTVGGTDEDQLWNATQTADGGFVLVGASVSGISGEKTEPHVGPYAYTDYWIVKLNNSGTIQWQNTIGGNRIDAALAVFENAAGELFINGNSGSIANGDKTEPNYGAANTADYWILKLNATGSIIWQKSIGGSNSDLATATTLCSDGGLIIAGTSFSPASGNKTTNLVGGDDIWIVKLEGGCAFNVELCNELDDNCNGLIDDGAVNTISIAALSGTVFCQGGSAVIEATHSGTGLQWRRNGVNIAGATSSTYTATTSGVYTCFSYSTCDTTESTAVNVTVNKNPKAQITAGGPTTFCTGGSVELTETPVAGCTYQWYKGATPIAGATSLTYAATTSGNYKCRVTKTATGCYKNSNSIAVSVPCKEGLPAGETGEMMNGEDAFSIFPNPNNGSFNISGSISNETVIEIVNSLGQLIYTKKLNSLNYFTAAISINNFVTGIYFVRLTNEVTITEQKMIIE
jgi:hypothetical protein